MGDYKPLTLMPWTGGKAQLRKRIAEYIPNELFKVWCEPFGGAGSMLFYKEQWGKKEVYNDLDGRLYNLFKVVKYHPREFYRQFKNSVYTAEEWYDYKFSSPQTDIQRAARFYYMIQLSFGGKGVVPGRRSDGKLLMLGGGVKELGCRIRNVYIEGKDYADIFAQYDSPDTFFYLDPPYDGSNFRYYTEKNKGPFDQEKFRDAVKNLKGRWLMSNADTPNIRKLWAGFSQVTFQRHLGINHAADIGREKVFGEILVASYDIEGVKSNTPLFNNQKGLNL